MKKKILYTLIIFIGILITTITTSNAQTIGDLRRMAEGNVWNFMNANFDRYTNGSTDTSIRGSRAAYCMDHIDSGITGGNGAWMYTTVVDVGKTGINSVNGLSTSNSVGAQRAMEIAYYATKSYQNYEPWGRTQSSPYRMMMLYKSAYYSTTMRSAGLFSWGLPSISYDVALSRFGAGLSQMYMAEARNYVSSTSNFAFQDNSTKNVQTIVEEDGLIFVGPYRIANSGRGYITNMTVKTASGTVCYADGWSTTPTSSSVRWNKNLPNGSSFYLVFRNQKPDSAKEVKVYKHVDGVLQARMVFCEDDGGQNIMIYGGTTDASKDYEISLPEVPFSYIKITKKDEDSGKALQGVGFIVYNETEGKWVKDGTPAQYVDNREDATVYVSNNAGQVNIRNLNKKGKYIIYEISNSNFGYEIATVDDPSNIVEVNISAVGQTVSPTVGNKRKYIKLSGYVWEDMISEKQSIRNYLYNADSNDDFDKLIANMTVSLRDKDGNLLKAEDGHEIQPRKTDSEGKYMFGDYLSEGYENELILIEDIIDGAYIEFEYNGMSYKSVPLNATADNGSKATDETNRNRSGENNPYFYSTRYATVTSNEATDTEGRVTNLEYDYANNRSTLKYASDTSGYIYGYEGQTYPIDGIDDKYKIFANTKDANNGIMGKGLTANDIYTNNMEEIPYINLGIMEREMPDLAVMQDIQNAKVTLNGYEHIYQYSQRFDDNGEFKENGEDGFNVSVKFGNKYLDNSYTREIYSSDLIYNQSEEGNGRLGVYITYKIAIRNEATNIYTRLNELANYYDNRFELIATGYNIDENGNVVNTIANQIVNGYDQYGYKKSIIYIGTGENISPIGSNDSNTVEIYVQYKLNNDAVNAVLNEDVTLGSITEVSSYSSFENGFSTVYSGVDKDSRPDSITPNDRSTYEDDTDSAPTLILKSTNTRIIAGTVWEDEIKDELLNATGYDKRREGNGEYEVSEEGTVAGVTVELLKVNEDGSYEPAILYDEIEQTTTYVTGTHEIDDNYYKTVGSYAFEGVIPGNYAIRYTYGDNSVIHGIDGTQTSVEAENYKSTKYRNYANETEDENDTNLYWYRAETGDATRLSDAKDMVGIKEDGTIIEDIVQERTINQNEATYNYNYINEQRELQDIQANTKRFDIKLDFDVNLDNISEYGANLKFVFDNIDFGIIRRPKQELKITKEISYIEIVLANGQTVIRGDPRNEHIQYLRYLPDEDGSGGIVYIEIDNEIIQGAVLNVEYEIKVDTTNAEVDYNDRNYYYYNTLPNNYNQPDGPWEMVTVDSLYDYVANDLNYDENNQAQDENGNPYWESVNLTDNMIGQEFSPEVYEQLKNYTKILNTDYFSDMNPGNREKTLGLYLTRVLANNEMDFTFDNDVEVHTTEHRPPDNSTPGNYDPSEGADEPDEDEVEIIITGPTGANQNYIIYGIIGLIVVIIFSTGIILIKKTLKK